VCVEPLQQGVDGVALHADGAPGGGYVVKMRHCALSVVAERGSIAVCADELTRLQVFKALVAGWVPNYGLRSVSRLGMH
jgi:hypothetical protein